MLGKLIKHEWKGLYKIGGIMLLATFAVALIGGLYFRSPMWVQLFNENGDIDNLASMTWLLMGIGSLVLCILMVVGLIYGMVIYLGVRFYRSMYTDEGYLAHTLPVTPHQLLGSKILVGGLWMLIANIVGMVSIFLMFFSMMASVFEGQQLGMSFWEIMREMWEGFTSLYENELGINVTGYMIYLVALFIVGSFSSLCILFGAITIGQLSKKYKAVMGILVYFGLLILISIIEMVISMVSMASSIMDGEIYMNTMFSPIISIAISVGLYFLSHYIIKRKLNLD